MLIKAKELNKKNILFHKAMTNIIRCQMILGNPWKPIATKSLNENNALALTRYNSPFISWLTVSRKTHSVVHGPYGRASRLSKPTAAEKVSVLFHSTIPQKFYPASFGIHTCSHVKSGRLPEHLVRPQDTHYPVVDHQPLPPQYLNYQVDRAAIVLPKKWN